MRVDVCPRCYFRIGFPFCQTCRLELTCMMAESADSSQKRRTFIRWLRKESTGMPEIKNNP